VDVAVKTAKNKRLPRRIDFCESGPVHRCIHAVSHIVEDHAEKIGISPRFAATKIIEGDEDIIAR
jgi:ferrous iron transport protein B